MDSEKRQVVAENGTDMHNSTAVTVGYVVNTYPRPSQTFIRREIRALEAQGLRVRRFAMRADSAALPDQADRAEKMATEYILAHGAAALGNALLRNLARAPQVLASVLRAGRQGGPGRGVLRQMIYLAEAAMLKRLCEDQGVTHLHAHFGTNSTDVVRYVKLLGGPGYSFTVHGPEEFDRPHGLSLGDKLADCRFAVAVSSFGRSQLSRWTDAANWDRIHVVHCGIEPRLFAAPAPLPEGPLRLVAIGRFAEQKGWHLLIDALSRATQPVDLTLVGDGPMGPSLRQAVAEAGLQDRVHLPGWLNEEGVRKAIANSHALVLPSFAEGLPVVLMEAMASARPAIATYIAGIPELMQGGKTGWLVPAGDAQAIADAIDSAATTPRDELIAMGRAARARALTRHDVEIEAAKLADLFRAQPQR